MKRLAILLLALPMAANASLIQFNVDLDLSTCVIGPIFTGVGCNLITPMPTQTLAVGDVVDFTVAFTNSGRLTMFDDDGGIERFYGWLDAVGSSSNFTISNASVTFANLIGTLTAPLFTASQSSGVAHIGPAFDLDFIATGSSISFTGYNVQFTIDALAVDPNTYSANWLLAEADRVTISVPEPGTLALLGIGLAGIGLARRRRIQ